MPVLTDPSGWFILRLPEGWESETEDCVTTLRGPLDLGVVFVSGGRHAGGRQAGFGGADFLVRFLTSIGVLIGEDDVARSARDGCRVYSYSRDAEGRYWRYWSITDEETALLISYTCPAEDCGRETDDVDDIIDSVRLFHSATVH